MRWTGIASSLFLLARVYFGSFSTVSAEIVGWLMSAYLYRARNRVERIFNRIKQCRRVATRYDRLAANYLAFVQLASIRLWLAARYESMP
jgi:transposase